MRGSYEPGCDYYCTPNCAVGHGKNHEPDMKTKRLTACTSHATYFVNCLHCTNVGVMDGEDVNWEQGYLMPD